MVIRVAPSGSVSCEISDFRIVVDPGPRERGNLILKTSSELPLAAASRELSSASPDVINHAGEYEISGIKIKGLEMESESLGHSPTGEPSPKNIKTTYLVEADGVHLCFLDGIAKELDDAFIEKLGKVDVLFISADKKSAEPKKLAALVKEVESHIIVSTNETAAESLSEGLGKKPEISDRLVVKRKDFEGEEGTKFVWIKEK